MSSTLCRAALRQRLLTSATRSAARTAPRVSRRHASSYPPPPPPPPDSDQGPQFQKPINFFAVSLAIAGCFSIVGGAYVFLPVLFSEKQEAPGLPQAEIQFEKKRKAVRDKVRDKEENRELISSQHVQVRNSWENPGVYAWGSNAGRVVAPDSNEQVVKTPRRIGWFDGMLLRDLKIDQDFGVAVTENGDLVQWGTGYCRENPMPTYTLRGKDITKLAISSDRIIALTSGGSVYSIPVPRSYQLLGEKPKEQSSWLSFWSNPTSTIHYRPLKPSNLGWTEKIVDISSGREHVLLLTSSGRVFSASSSSESFPSKGQLGIPGLTWLTRPQGPVDQPYEIETLKDFKVKKIATGDYHSLVLDNQGRVFAFGDNSVGQLGFPLEPRAPTFDTPSLLPISMLYNGTGLTPKVTSVEAGGLNSFITVDAARAATPASTTDNLAPARALAKIVADTWVTGGGIHGNLGTGKWAHMSNGLNKIKALSGMSEWDEKANAIMPIRLSSLSAGPTHTAAVIGNATNVKASSKTNENDTNWGADVVWWGGNEFYQLGNGKRSNSNTPLYIAPLDSGAGDAKAVRKGDEHRFQVTPRQTVRLGKDGKGRKVSVEQRVECGRNVTAVYSGT